MTTSSSCINDVIPSDILQNIFLLSANSFSDALRISTTCQLWRKLIFNPFMIEHYWAFDDEHRKKGLVRWWNFDGNVDNPSDPFAIFPTVDCFLGKCASLIYEKVSSEDIVNDESQYNIDRGSNYTVALWLLISKPVDECCCLFMLSDGDWDYNRSTGVGINENNLISILFQSCISNRIAESDVKIRPDEWFHITLVQERKLDEETPQQTLWINGQRTITVEVPIAAYSDAATISFAPFNRWDRSIGDVSLWSRCLSPVEIRAIYKQKTSINKVHIGKYICEHWNK